MERRVRLRIGLLLAMAAVAVCCATPAQAAGGHSQLLSTSPADGAVLGSPPAEVVFTFDAPLLPDTPTVSINNAAGHVVSSIHPPPEGASVAIPWPAGTAPGDYQVAFRVVCADGQPLIGAIRLTITADGAPASGGGQSATTTAPIAASTPAATSPVAPAQGLPLAALLGLVVVLAAVIAVAVVAVTRRSTSSPPSPR